MDEPSVQKSDKAIGIAPAGLRVAEYKKATVFALLSLLSGHCHAYDRNESTEFTLNSLINAKLVRCPLKQSRTIPLCSQYWPKAVSAAFLTRLAAMDGSGMRFKA